MNDNRMKALMTGSINCEAALNEDVMEGNWKAREGKKRIESKYMMYVLILIMELHTEYLV